MPSDLLALHSIAADVTYWLRRDFEKSGLPGHIVLMISPIIGYLTEFLGRPLVITSDGITGLAPDFIDWLKKNPPPGGSDDGEELRAFISDYPQAQTEKA